VHVKRVVDHPRGGTHSTARGRAQVVLVDDVHGRLLGRHRVVVADVGVTDGVSLEVGVVGVGARLGEPRPLVAVESADIRGLPGQPHVERLTRALLELGRPPLSGAERLIRHRHVAHGGVARPQ
jgi:hypothetical protein